LLFQLGLQIAKIKAQEFADGGQIKSLGNGKIKAKPNTKPTAKGDNVLAYVKAGEVILNERQQELAGGPEFFRSLGVPGFCRVVEKCQLQTSQVTDRAATIKRLQYQMSK
jgi:hypothetical protein